MITTMWVTPHHSIQTRAITPNGRSPQAIKLVLETYIKHALFQRKFGVSPAAAMTIVIGDLS